VARLIQTANVTIVLRASFKVLDLDSGESAHATRGAAPRTGGKNIDWAALKKMKREWISWSKRTMETDLTERSNRRNKIQHVDKVWFLLNSPGLFFSRSSLALSFPNWSPHLNFPLDSFYASRNSEGPEKILCLFDLCLKGSDQYNSWNNIDCDQHHRSCS